MRLTGRPPACAFSVSRSKKKSYTLARKNERLLPAGSAFVNTEVVLVLIKGSIIAGLDLRAPASSLVSSNALVLLLVMFLVMLSHISFQYHCSCLVGCIPMHVHEPCLQNYH